MNIKTMPKSLRQTTFEDSGFSLIEGMVATVILSIGLLALSGMQSLAFVKNVDANELTRVSTLAADILERIQFNRRNAIAYNGIDTQSGTNCSGINAAAQPMASGDCLLWDTLVDGTLLENIKGTVSVSNVIEPAVLGQRNVAVTITWVGSQKSDKTIKRSRTLTLQRVVAPE